MPLWSGLGAIICFCMWKRPGGWPLEEDGYKDIHALYLGVNMDNRLKWKTNTEAGDEQALFTNGVNVCTKWWKFYVTLLWEAQCTQESAGIAATDVTAAAVVVVIVVLKNAKKKKKKMYKQDYISYWAEKKMPLSLVKLHMPNSSIRVTNNISLIQCASADGCKKLKIKSLIITVTRCRSIWMLGGSWEVSIFSWFFFFFLNRSVIPKRADERVVVERNTQSVQ